MISKRLIHVNCLSNEAKTAVYTYYLALSLLASSLSGAAKLETAGFEKKREGHLKNKYM